MKNIILSVIVFATSHALFAASSIQTLRADTTRAMGTSGGGNPPAMTTELLSAANAMGTGGGGTPPAMATAIDELLSEVNSIDLERDLTKTPIERTVLQRDIEAIVSAGLHVRPLPLTTKDGKLIELSPDKFVFEKGRLTIPVGARTMILYKASEEN